MQTLKIIYHKDFVKNYARLPIATKERFKEKHEIFMNNPFNMLLRNHPLKGKMKGRWAFSIERNIRVIYEYIGPNIVIFLKIGSHNQVYK